MFIENGSKISGKIVQTLLESEYAQNKIELLNSLTIEMNSLSLHLFETNVEKSLLKLVSTATSVSNDH